MGKTWVDLVELRDEAGESGQTYTGRKQGPELLLVMGAS
jgi:hypothetical protein